MRSQSLRDKYNASILSKEQLLSLFYPPPRHSASEMNQWDKSSRWMHEMNGRDEWMSWMNEMNEWD